MVYYKNGKVKGFTKKIALPLALAASAFTPVMAETTLKVVGPEGNKIAFDETKEVKLNMTSQGDNVSFVEVNIELPAGLQYVEGSFKKADIEALKAHQYKVTLTPKGFHVAIYSDNLASMGDMTDTTIGTFDVKANTKLSGGNNIKMTIVDLTDKDAEQIDYSNVGAGNVEGAEGDNSIGSETVAIDKSTFPGDWKVYTVAALNADGLLEFNPLFDAQTISVALKNDIAQIAGLEFQLQLPVGLKLKEATLLPNGDRKVGQNLSFQKLDIDGSDNDYKVFYLGGDQPFKLTDGALLSFEVEADLTLANDPEDFTDKILIQKIKLTDIYSVAVSNEDLEITVFNPNQKAYYNQTNALNEVEEWAKAEPFTRVYDYAKVLEARKLANETMEDLYLKGELGYQDNEQNVADLIAAYKAEIEADAAENEKIYNDLMNGDENDDIKGVQELRDELAAADQPQYPAEEEVAGARALTPGEIEEPIPGFDEENPYIETQKEIAEQIKANLDALDEVRVAATVAIDAFETRIQELYDQKENDPNADRYDGALLTEEAKDELNELGTAAEDAVAAFVEKRDQVNADNKAIFEGALEEAKAYIDALTAETNEAENGPYVNDYKELPQVKEAIEAAQAAIDENAAAIALPYKEGLVAVVRALQDLTNVADDAKAKNDEFQEAIGDALGNAKDALESAKERLEMIREADPYKYIDSSDKTADLMDAIDEKVADLEERIAAIEEAVNDEAGYPNEEAPDQEAEEEIVNGYLEALGQILDEIEGVENAETGELENGLDQDIQNAVDTYNKYHQRGDANMDGRVSVFDYNYIMQYVREELNVEEVTAEQLSQLNVVQEEAFGDDIEINITDAIGALWIYLNGGTDEGLGLGDRYYSARAAEQESLVATSQMVNGVRRIALNLSNAQEFTAAQLDVVLPEGATIIGAQLGELNNGHQLFVGNVKNGRQRVVISNNDLKAFKGAEGAVLYIDVDAAVEAQFDNVIFATTEAQSVRFNVAKGNATGIAGVKAAGEGEQVYSLGGRMMNVLKKGVNIIRRADGSTQKVIKK